MADWDFVVVDPVPMKPAENLVHEEVYEEASSEVDLRAAAAGGSDDIIKEDVDDNARKVSVPVALLVTHLICAILGRFIGKRAGDKTKRRLEDKLAVANADAKRRTELLLIQLLQAKARRLSCTS